MSVKMLGPYGEEIVYIDKFPKSLLKEKNSYWFVDSIFKKHQTFKNIKNISFVKAGETAKSFASLESNFKKLLSKNANRQTKVYCVGGGSLGDSIGFLSSIYMRGLRLVMLPTTWLACIDSSIGGKTALNGFGYKNIMGSFYPPEKHVYIRELIQTSSIKGAEGEIFKTLILNHNKKWAKELMFSYKDEGIKFSDLVHFVTYKTNLVKKDPNDLKGVRAVLNLGHTLGHALELEKNLSHSEAVKQGVLFSTCWSERKGILSSKKKEYFEALLSTQLAKISAAKLEKTLLKDKKNTERKSLNFVFVGNKGSVVEKISINKIVQEYQRQLSEQLKND